MKKQTKMSIAVNIASALFFALSFSGYINASRVTCKTFATRVAAQKMFDLDPQMYRSLDRNHNGKACESLKK